MRPTSALLGAAVLASAFATLPAQAQPAPARPAAPAGPVQIVSQGSWAAFSVNDPRGRFCYAISTPTSANPPATPPRRDPTNLFITARPRQNVRNEISIIIGYVFQPNSQVTIEITGGAQPARFNMFTRDRSAFVENAAQETQMIAAMRSGRELVVRGTSSRGTATTDRYALAGIAAVLDRMATECR